MSKAALKSSGSRFHKTEHEGDRRKSQVATQNHLSLYFERTVPLTQTSYLSAVQAGALLGPLTLTLPRGLYKGASLSWCTADARARFDSRERFSEIFGPFRFQYSKCKCVIIVLKDFSKETELNSKHVYSGFYVKLLSQTLTQTVSFSMLSLPFFPL